MLFNNLHALRILGFAIIASSTLAYAQAGDPLDQIGQAIDPMIADEEKANNPTGAINVETSGALEKELALPQENVVSPPTTPNLRPDAQIKKSKVRSKAPSFGHNVAQTSNVFPAGDCTIGTFLVGCGLTDKLTIGMSPWLYVSYNSDNAMLRYQLTKSKRDSSAFQLAYVKSFDSNMKLPSKGDPSSADYESDYCARTRKCFTGYEMETLWTYYAYSYRYTQNFTLHSNVQVAYYWNDKKPFSIRRPQAVRTPWQSNISFLNEVMLVKSFYLHGEFGVLGITEKYPALHSGVTIEYRGINWSIRVGGSGTGSLAGWWGVDRFDYHSYALYASNEGLERKFTDAELQKDFSVHPEIYVQYSFSL